MSNTGVERGVDDVTSSIDVGFDGFDGIVFTGGHLLEGGCMDNDIHLLEGAAQADAIANIPDEIAERGVVVASDTHFMLLQFIAAEDDELPRMKFAQHDFGEFFADEPVPPVTSTVLPFNSFAICSLVCDWEKER